MLDLEKAFNPETKSIHTFYQSPGVGFYIPLYQRDYSWDSDNVSQLLDDIAKGIENLVENDAGEIRFLGTIITVIESNKRGIEPQDPQGLPSSIEKVIDGQQRLSTITLLASQLYHHIIKLEDTLSKHDDENVKEQISEVCKYWKDKLIDIFSLDLKRGTPPRKPKIIRGNKDAWTKDGNIEDYYKSEVSKYLADFISYAEGEIEKAPKAERKHKVGQNITQINRWIKKDVLEAHINDSDDFLPAWKILNQVTHEHLWSYDRLDLEDLLKQADNKDKKSLPYLVCSFVQIFAVCHYLLDRCCFTIIQPKNDDWAFDMFQSLNATGTPLTAIETFQPVVVRNTNEKEGSYKKSRVAKSFERIDQLFKGTKTAAQKSRLATDFLTSFRIAMDGGKLESHFSKQRKWLDQVYSTKLESYKDQCEFINFFGNYATFYKEIWQDYDGAKGVISQIVGHQEAMYASLIVLYLKSANHKMAITILATLYNGILEGKDNSINNFVEGCKAIGRFYTLWRSAKSNAGLDNVYREYFKGTKDGSEIGHGWTHDKTFDVNDLKAYFNRVLHREEIGTLEEWLPKAVRNLKYNASKPVCRFALFVASHDTIPDPENPGLMKQGTSYCSPYLTLERWNSEDLKHIEHIAPEEGATHAWDPELYTDDEWYQSIGNLTLLPAKVNISASNKGWKEKLLYYKHISERDPQKQQELKNKALVEGIDLQKSTIKILQEAHHSEHISSIVTVGESKKWDVNLVKSRAERVCTLVWNSQRR